jgi:hypothetical protein
MISDWNSGTEGRLWGQAHVLEVLHKEEGITIGHLLVALITHADAVIENRACEAADLVLALHCMHWRLDIWKLREVYSCT